MWRYCILERRVILTAEFTKAFKLGLRVKFGAFQMAIHGLLCVGDSGDGKGLEVILK